MADLSLSRVTSLSKSSRNGSTKSRSLIKKSLESHDLNPADLLIDRFTTWKIIVRQLVAYFQGIADIENNTAREMTKLAAVVQVPFRSGNQFLGEGGLQDVFYAIRDKTRQIADQHADLGRTIDSSIVQHLQKLLLEVKAHLKNVQNDTAKLASGVAKEREASTKLVGELANDISAFRNTPMNISAKRDPYIANQAVASQLQKQVLEENLLQKSIIMMQQNSAHFEEGIVHAIQSAWHTFDEWQSRASTANQEIYRSLASHMSSLPADREWITFAARSDHLLHPETPLRDPSHINYPCKEDPSVFAVHTGHLERKRRFTRAYQEGYYVLTPAGFLHSFTTSDPSHPGGLVPTFSLFLPMCTLGPPSGPNAKSHKFHIEGRKDGTGTTKSGSLRGLLGGDNTMAWSFRARSREDMMEWWNDTRMLCARYLIASEQIERNGPVEAAVRSAGYQSGDDELEDEYEEGEGSSVEEEVDEVYQDVATTATEPPGYSYEKVHSGIEIGPNGYALEKKHNDGADVGRRHSLRQQEKAPEGKTPHAYYEPGTVSMDGVGDGVVMDHGMSRHSSHSQSLNHHTIRGTGFIPDDIGRPGGYVGQPITQDHYGSQQSHHQYSTSSPQATGNDTTIRAQPEQNLSPRLDGNGSRSPRVGQGSGSPQHVQHSPSSHQMQMASRGSGTGQGQIALSPREATQSPVYPGGTILPSTTHYRGSGSGSVHGSGHGSPDIPPPVGLGTSNDV